MKKKYIVGTLLFLLISAMITFCSIPKGLETNFDTDPITTLGHGAFIGSDGKEFVPDANFVEDAQQYYISFLKESYEVGKDQSGISDSEVRRIEKLIFEEVKDKTLANALWIDWLLEKVEVNNVAHLTMVNNALRWYYLINLAEDGIMPDKDKNWSKGIDFETAEKLNKEGIDVFAVTNAGGAKYRQECADAGVPVPKAMFSSEWEFQDVFDNEFISTSSQAELWLYKSDSPEGVCIALPRYRVDGGNVSDDAVLLGIICLGTQSNNACFFDNPNGTVFNRDVEVPISDFVGGTDLVINGQGTCSDCHSGENPYVVHPEKSAFSGLGSLHMPSQWYSPLVHETWPQNPGPSNILAGISSPGKCNSCHIQGSAGRFPEISTQLSGYCSSVLGNAVSGSKRTMPPFGADITRFVNHIDALQNSCSVPPENGVVVEVDFPNDRSYISPPKINDPLYQCASKIAVQGAILNAKVDLFINGSLKETISPARNTTELVFDISPELVAGDKVTARQESDGIMSAMSPEVIVRDHKVDFPNGLPAPEISPTSVYECAGVIAVKHVPGAKVTVYSNGGDPRGRNTSTGYSAIRPTKRPFDIGDTFTAEISLCGDVSPMSAPISVVAAPTSFPPAAFNPTTLYVGQELVSVNNLTYGSQTTIAEASFGVLRKFSTPISWKSDIDIATPLGRPLASGDQLTLEQSLCDLNSKPISTKPTEECESIPAPRIRPPLAGENFIIVSESIAGARIRIYDDNNNELGDGSGTVILLNRDLVASDIVTAVQQVGKCTSKNGHQVNVREVKRESKKDS